MSEIFHVYIANGPEYSAELDLPASDHEMLDAIERLRLEPDEPVYLEAVECADGFDYLRIGQVTNPTDVFQLNVLARQLEKLEVQGMAAFEGLVGMDIQKEQIPISISRLIDFACSADCCHVVEDAATDYALGRFLAENGFVPEAEDLPEAAFELLDFGRIGKEHRESEGGVFTGFGYVDQHADLHSVGENMDFQLRSPAYTILLNMAPPPFVRKAGPDDTVQMRLPAPEGQMQEALKKMGVSDWKYVDSSIQDCAIPQLIDEFYMNGEVPQIAELAQCLSQLDARGEMPKYKAILAAMDSKDIGQAIALAGTVDEYVFSPKTSCPEDVAMSELRVMVGNDEADAFARYVNLQAFGLSLLERDHAVITGYGLIERQDGQPIQTIEQKTEGMVMT